MRISLNLATRPFADVGPAIKRLRIAVGALVIMAIGLGLGIRALHQRAEEARARDHSLDGQIARITRERQGYQDMMRLPANALLISQVGALNNLFDEKAFSWTLAMEDLETVLPGGVQVSTIEPVRAKDGHITLHLRVIGPRDRAVDLVRNLEHSRRFLLPRIVGENAEATGGLGQKLEPVSASNRFDFDLLAEYNWVAPEERKAGKSTGKPSPSKGEESEEAPVQPHLAPGINHEPGRPPYTAKPWPVKPQAKPNPAVNGNPASGGPR